MKSSAQQLKKILDDYLKRRSGDNTIAIENFQWVVQCAIDYAETYEKR